jgi:hypothetical protein
VSPAAKLCGFFLLLAVIFGAAHLTGSGLGPVTTGHAPATNNQPGQRMNMNMGAPASGGGQP